MSESDKRSIFFDRLKKIILQNSDFDIDWNFVYGELLKFNPSSNGYDEVNTDSLINVQGYLKNNIDGGYFFSDGYYLYFNNAGDVKKEEFYKEMYNSIKIYISCDINNIYSVSKKLLEFVLKENISVQFKIAKEMRNDAILIRVARREAATKVIDFINSLDYESTTYVNPFIFRDSDKVSLAWDGHRSYNQTLSMLFANYFNGKKDSNSVDSASIEDFIIFIKRELINCENADYFRYFYTFFEKKSTYDDFVKIVNIIIDNMEGTLTRDKLFAYQQSGTQKKGNTLSYEKKEELLLYVIHKLSLYYSVEEVHKIIMIYTGIGKSDIFTRRDNIRSIVNDNFTPKEMEEMILDIGVKSFDECVNLTNKKYGKKQSIGAVMEFIVDNELYYFTGDMEVRSKLGLVVPEAWYKMIIKRELEKIGATNDYEEVIDGVGLLSKEDRKSLSKKSKCIMNDSDSFTDNDASYIMVRKIIEIAELIYNNVIKEQKKKK